MSFPSNTALLWNVVIGQHKSTLTGYKHPIYSVVFSPDGKTLAGGSYDDTILLWDVVTGEREGTFTGHTSWLKIAFSPDGKTLASGGAEQTIWLWNVVTGQQKHTLHRAYRFSQ